jgi:hypothetical protein
MTQRDSVKKLLNEAAADQARRLLLQIGSILGVVATRRAGSTAAEWRAPDEDLDKVDRAFPVVDGASVVGSALVDRRGPRRRRIAQDTAVFKVHMGIIMIAMAT